MQLYHVPAEHAGRLPYVNLTIERRFYEISLISFFSAILTGSMQAFMKNEKSDPFRAALGSHAAMDFCRYNFNTSQPASL